ncbi:hypothetical protein [Streptomyces sp. NPDC093111]|uniref:hypothetical protein n=1 Tax=Streptomyces sp. NPDC093111 TaxID=3154978 RepID=UPI003413F701
MSAGFIVNGRVFAACHPEDTARLRIVRYQPGELRALVADAATGARQRSILVSSLHDSPLTRTGGRRRSGYAPDDDWEPEAPPPMVEAAVEPNVGEVDWFQGLPGRRFRVALPPRLILLNANERLHHHWPCSRVPTADIRRF